jgi:hypothetical protein
MTTAAEVAALLQPIPSFVGSCAASPFGVSDDVPVGNGRFEDVIAIGKVFGADGMLHGWVFKTAGNHVLIQRVTPALPRDGKSNASRVYTDLRAFHATTGETIVACTSADFHYARSLRI